MASLLLVDARQMSPSLPVRMYEMHTLVGPD